MGTFPRPNIVWRGAHPNNFTVGRPGGGLDGRNTYHHIVGSAESAVLVFNQAGRSASTHLVITDRADVAAWQCVDFANTAWGDGNWESNLRTINMEHHGDWRGGYDSSQVRENSAHVVAWLRDQGLVSRPIRHRDVKPDTACPADLPVEAIWDRATQLLNGWYAPTPAPVPQWLGNRQEISGKTVYAQSEGIFIVNLNDGRSAADSRRFVLNQNFEITGQTVVDGVEFYITRSSMNAQAANGIRKDQVADQPWTAPAPTPTPVPQPSTPHWYDSVIDDENREKYVLRATQLINLETGRPAVDTSGKEIWYQAGDIIQNVSAHTIVSEITYELTEYSYSNVKAGKTGVANGIKASDLTIDPKATPEGTPANPTPADPPEDDPVEMPDVPTPTTPSKDDEQDARLDALEKLIAAIVEFFKGLVGGITKK